MHLRVTWPATRYAAALVIVAASLGARWLLDPLLGDRQPYTLVIVAAAVVARTCGLGPALVGLAGGSSAALWLFVEPRATFVVPTFGDWFGLIAAAAGGTIVAWLIDRLVRQRNSLALAAEALAEKERILRRLVDVQESEKQTLCHDIHDGLLQEVLGAQMLLEGLRNSGTAVASGTLDEATRAIKRGVAEGRRAIRGIRTAVLDDLGLAAAIDDLADQTEEAGIVVEKSIEADLGTLPQALETTIYRVIQEALSNVRRHAAADRVRLGVSVADGTIVVTVADTGRGFDVDAARQRGFGLVGMAERVRLAAGHCQIDSAPGTGTRIEARLPLSEPHAPLGADFHHAPGAPAGTTAMPSARR